MFITGCSAQPLTNKVSDNGKAIAKYSIANAYDDVWNKLIRFLAINNYKIEIKDKEAGVLKVTLTDATITYFDKRGVKVENPKAIAVTDSRRRVNNQNNVLPSAANITCTILLSKKTERETDVVISLDNICNVTAYYEEGFLRRKKIPNVVIQSTGYFEKDVTDSLK